MLAGGAEEGRLGLREMTVAVDMVISVFRAGVGFCLWQGGCGNDNDSLVSEVEELDGVRTNNDDFS